jgi:chromosome segregation ATPase
MCLERFGVEYKTGEYARKKSVEQLKAESYRELLLTVEKLSGNVQLLQQQLDFTKSQLREQYQTGNRVLTALNAEISSKTTDMEKIKESIENAKSQAMEVEKRLRSVAEKIESGKIDDLEIKNILYCLEKHPGRQKIMETFRTLNDMGEKMLSQDLARQAAELQKIFDDLKTDSPARAEHRERI